MSKGVMDFTVTLTDVEWRQVLRGLGMLKDDVLIDERWVRKHLSHYAKGATEKLAQRASLINGVIEKIKGVTGDE